MFYTPLTTKNNEIVLQDDKTDFFSKNFAAVNIFFKPDLKVINRKTNSLLDWLGEWGGLLDGLNFLGRNIMNPYTTYTLQYVLSYMLVRFVPSSSVTKADIADDQEKKKAFYAKYFDKNELSKNLV